MQLLNLEFLSFHNCKTEVPFLVKLPSFGGYFHKQQKNGLRHVTYQFILLCRSYSLCPGIKILNSAHRYHLNVPPLPLCPWIFQTKNLPASSNFLAYLLHASDTPFFWFSYTYTLHSLPILLIQLHLHILCLIMAADQLLALHHNIRRE